MNPHKARERSADRCDFIGGSDARIIMGQDEKALWIHLRSRTPGPPPFLSMNSTPALSKARRTAKSLAAVMEVSWSAFSARRIVANPSAASLARSSALQRTRPRAALIWALVRGLNATLDFFKVT
jgi:hypothetical protein